MDASSFSSSFPFLLLLLVIVRCGLLPRTERNKYSGCVRPKQEEEEETTLPRMLLASSSNFGHGEEKRGGGENEKEEEEMPLAWKIAISCFPSLLSSAARQEKRAKYYHLFIA